MNEQNLKENCWCYLIVFVLIVSLGLNLASYTSSILIFFFLWGVNLFIVRGYSLQKEYYKLKGMADVLSHTIQKLPKSDNESQVSNLAKEIGEQIIDSCESIISLITHPIFQRLLFGKFIDLQEETKALLDELLED